MIPRNSVASNQVEAIQREFFEESYSVEDLSRRHFLPVDQIEAAIRRPRDEVEKDEDEVEDLRTQVRDFEAVMRKLRNRLNEALNLLDEVE